METIVELFYPSPSFTFLFLSYFLFPFKKKKIGFQCLDSRDVSETEGHGLSCFVAVVQDVISAHVFFSSTTANIHFKILKKLNSRMSKLELSSRTNWCSTQVHLHNL